MGILKSTRTYEKWLGRHTPLIQADLDRRHELMAEAAFPFMRATFYRWIGRFGKICPELNAARKVLAVGDLHVDNFGTWRDAVGRMAWGINDFDETYPLPYTQDLIRLATSALLAIRTEHLSIAEDQAMAAILSGYRESLSAGGRPIVVDESNRWLAPLVWQSARDPAKFWQKMRALPEAQVRAPKPALEALRSLLPDPKATLRLSHRIAGLGSLGKMRFVTIVDSCGGPIARETKPLTPSAAAWLAGKRRPMLHYADVLKRAVRVKDPWFAVHDRWLVRRLAPDCGRIELASLPRVRDDEQLLSAMGWETANVHLGTRGSGKAILRDLKSRRRPWLRKGAEAMLQAVLKDWNQWRKRWESPDGE